MDINIHHVESYQSIVRDDWKEKRRRAERDCVIADLTRYLNESDELLKRARSVAQIAFDDSKLLENCTTNCNDLLLQLMRDIDNLLGTEGQ